jgi:hypothetical protein
MPAGPRRNAAEVLLDLLDRVPDAATLELLLEPEHLAQLLRAQGHSDEDIRRELSSGRSPGELLLEVLQQKPDVSAHLALLGNPRPAERPPARAPSAEPGAGPSPAPAVARVIAGLALAVPSGWYLFVRLDVLHAPGLIQHFPGAYALLAGLLGGGLYLVVTGLVRRRGR